MAGAVAVTLSTSTPAFVEPRLVADNPSSSLRSGPYLPAKTYLTSGRYYSVPRRYFIKHARSLGHLVVSGRYTSRVGSRLRNPRQVAAAERILDELSKSGILARSRQIRR
jgi:hypothetical protein